VSTNCTVVDLIAVEAIARSEVTDLALNLPLLGLQAQELALPPRATASSQQREHSATCRSRLRGS